MQTNSRNLISFEVLQAAHYEEAVACLNYQFVQANPLAKILDIKPEEHLYLTQAITQEAIKQELSIVAIDRQTKKLQGVSICLDLETPPFLDLELVCPKIEPIFDMMDQMKNKYRKIHQSKPGEVVESFMTAV